MFDEHNRSPLALCSSSSFHVAEVAMVHPGKDRSAFPELPVSQGPHCDSYASERQRHKIQGCPGSL